MVQQSFNTLVKAIRNFWSILSIDKKDVSAVYFFAILGGLIQLSLPLGIQTIMTLVMANQVTASIVVLIIIVVLGVFLNGLLQIRQMQVIERIEQKIFVRYSLEFADRLPRLNIEKLDNYYLPELVNRYFDTVSLSKGIEKILLDIPGAIIQVVFGLTLLSFYHPVFIVFGAVLLFIVIIIVRFTSPKGLETSIEASDYKYKIAAWFEEMARGIKSFKYSKGTSLHMHKTDKLVTNWLDARISHFRILLTQYWSFILFKVIIVATMLIIGVALVISTEITVGQFIAADIVIILILNSVEKLIASLDKIYDALTSIQKLSKVVESETETGGTIDLQPADKGVSIEFKNVHYTYPDGVKVLNGLNLSVAPGQLVCIYGPSGSGKSSIIRMLTGAFKNYEGSIMLNDIPLGNYTLASLREQTGLLLNQQDIFNGTIWENVTMGNPSVTHKEVATLAGIVDLQQFIQSGKDGFETQLDPQGKRLPQRIRHSILLLRALVGQHRLLLLEQPFEHLTIQQQADIRKYLRENTAATVVYTSLSEPLPDSYDVILRLS